jgi:hypothetical protein
VFSQVTVDAVTPVTPKESASNRAYFSINLPRLDLGTNELVSGSVMESKTISISKPLFGKLTVDKASLVPKCFTKCCNRCGGRGKGG